jgi:hypothetical protein
MWKDRKRLPVTKITNYSHRENLVYASSWDFNDKKKDTLNGMNNIKIGKGCCELVWESLV